MGSGWAHLRETLSRIEGGNVSPEFSLLNVLSTRELLADRDALEDRALRAEYSLAAVREVVGDALKALRQHAPVEHEPDCTVYSKPRQPCDAECGYEAFDAALKALERI